MHPRLEHLLSLRDGEPVDATVREHASGCSRCSATLREADELRSRLRALPPVGAAKDGWSALQARLGEHRSAALRRAWGARVAVAASVAVIAAAIGWRIADTSLEQSAAARAMPAPLTAEQALALDRVAQLQTQSDALDAMLVALGDRPAVERAGSTLPIDTLESQVQWVDHQLSSGDAALEPASAEQLWRERVEALNSLVRLRYVEAQRISM
jgi:hypothetical protein